MSHPIFGHRQGQLFGTIGGRISGDLHTRTYYSRRINRNEDPTRSCYPRSVMLLSVHHDRQRLSTGSRSLVAPTNLVLQDIHHIDEVTKLKKEFQQEIKRTSWNPSHLAFQGLNLVL